MTGNQPNRELTDGQSPDLRIPIVDFAAWKPYSSLGHRLKVARDLVSACRSVGFVYIINHGMPKETLDKAFEITKALYDLPQEDKIKAPHPPGWAHHRGYSWPGLEKVSAALSEKDDTKMVEQLRVVTDCKVWLSHRGWLDVRQLLLKQQAGKLRDRV